jgi:hypothetical protein
VINLADSADAGCRQLHDREPTSWWSYQASSLARCSGEIVADPGSPLMVASAVTGRRRPEERHRLQAVVP